MQLLSYSLWLKSTFWSAVRGDWLGDGCSLGWVSHCECSKSMSKLSWLMWKIFKFYIQNASSSEGVTVVFNPHVVVIYIEKFLSICSLTGSFESQWYRVDV